MLEHVMQLVCFLQPSAANPAVDLLGDDDDFAPYVQAPDSTEFGFFQEAATNQVASPLSPSVTGSCLARSSLLIVL